MYVPIIGAPQYIIQILITVIKGETDNSTIIVGALTPYIYQQIFQRENQRGNTDLNDTVAQSDLVDIYRGFQKHSRAAEYKFFSSAHVIFSRTDHRLSHKVGLSKFKKIKIIPSILSKHKAMKLEINYKKKTCKTHKYTTK